MKLTYLGHSGCLIETETHRILIDPFLTGNPKVGMTREAVIALKPTHITLSHGHDDHIGDAPAIAAALKIPVLGMVEVCRYLRQAHGLENLQEANYGGTIELGSGHAVTLVPAWHSSSSGKENTYTGNPCGLIITTPEATLYHAGDTSIFGDMALIDEMYKPTIGLLPIGDRYTMDAKAAALACRKFFHFTHIVPLHYGTFPVLAKNADAFVDDNEDLPIYPMTPGESLNL